MKFPVIDKRNKNDILDHIKSIAPGYTSEWRFDEDNPDVGTSLAMIFADMFTGTINRFNRVTEKNMVAFFNELNASLLPSIPAAGYVKFGLAGTPEDGVAVRQGTRLLADSESEEVEKVVFETINDVYVTPAVPEDLYCVSGQNDYISKVCNLSEEDLKANSKYLFSMNGENLQSHYIYFSHKNGLNIENGAWLQIQLTPYYQNSVSEELLEKFLDEKYAVWEFESTEGFLPFEGAKSHEGGLLFFKSDKQPKFAVTKHYDQESRWIRCLVKNVEPFKEFFISNLSLKVKGAGILPQVITGGGADRNVYECFPFGEKMSVYSDVYFASEEVLTKKGAQVVLSFNLNFVQIPVDLEVTDPNINWKLIMKRSDFKPDVEYDITIEDVIWEYYNGKGWARLFPDNSYSDVFTTKHGTMGQYRTIKFTCPEDMEPILVNSCQSCYIRAQILKVNNAYKIKGNYITPLIEGTTFQYEYLENSLVPEMLYVENGLEEEVYTGDILGGKEEIFFRPFKKLSNDEIALYMAFETAPKDGPIKLLVFLEDSMKEKLPRLSWEYYGRKGWTTLNVVDETENFRKTGIVSMTGAYDFELCTLFRQEKYWIRVTDTAGRYNNKRQPVQLPLLSGFHINATQVRNIERKPEELFYVEPHQSNCVCSLLNGNVQETEVFVKENGEWVQWEEVEDFASSEPHDRHFMVDRTVGKIMFSDDRNGKIPTSSDEETVRVSYAVGGGSFGNLNPGMVNRLYTAIGFINQVENPERTSGGCDLELPGESIRRNAAALKHGYRAVTVKDYETLAYEATRNISKAKCFAGRNDTGEKEPGAVTLVLLQKDLKEGRNFFGTIKEQVYNYISKRATGAIVDTNKFYVVEPKLLEFCIKMEFTVENFNHVFRAREEVEKRLAEFIDPMTGNFDGKGWEIGQLPNRTQILNSLKDVPYVSFIKSVFVSAYSDGKFGKTEVDLEKLTDRVYAIPISGKHEILITIDEER